jgi:23S rRNA (uridine2552-2'-O)-methyltransferase
MAHEVQDHFFRQAKRDGYLSRAAYKLIEIDDRKKLLSKGDRVLDCGAAPGSWLQVAARRVGPKGAVVGIDLKPITHRFGEKNISLLQGDLTETAAEQLRDGGKLFDVVLSDMAPNTTGDRLVDHHGSVRLCDAVLERCVDVLKPGGILVMKVFEGEAYPDLLQRTRDRFAKVKGFKPKASRDSSTEMYVIAEGFKG